MLLVDAGDHAKGTAYGSMDKGETIIKLMNASGYDLATLGNHEFDYGMFACLQTVTGQQILDALEWGRVLLVKQKEEFRLFYML